MCLLSFSFSSELPVSFVLLIIFSTNSFHLLFKIHANNKSSYIILIQKLQHIFVAIDRQKKLKRSTDIHNYIKMVRLLAKKPIDNVLYLFVA